MATVMSNAPASLRLVKIQAAGRSARFPAASQSLQLQPLPLVSPSSRVTRAAPHVIAHAARFHAAAPSTTLLQPSHFATAHQSRRLITSRAADAEAAATVEEEAKSSGGSTVEGEKESANGSATSSKDGEEAPLSGVAYDTWALKPGGELSLGGPTGMIGELGMKLRLLFEAPWKRVKKGSVLSIRLSGAIPELITGGPFSSSLSLHQLCDCIRKAAIDPRISALVISVDPLAAGWGKLQEVVRHIQLFRKSGKLSLAYMSVGGEKEYFVASACEEVYAPPSAYVSLRGLAVQGQFLGGVLEKAGVQPQIQRIGKFKSAGDQLSRKDMSEPNREMLTALLEDFYSFWTSAVAEARGKSVEEVEALLNDGVQTMEELKERGFLTDIRYTIEIENMLKERLGQTNKDKPLRAVDSRKYRRVSLRTLGLAGGDRIAVLRAVGAISRGKATSGSGGVKSESFIEKIRMVKENKQFKAVVLRIDSPGGDALASDLMWNELRELAKVKPLVASMSDVAASGGYYMAMAAPTVVAESLTLTGSVGVVTGKFNLGSLYERVGFAKEIISRGKFAQLDADNRPFTPEEEQFFERGAQLAYKSFRDKAALSRSLSEEDMERVAQGRVWTGKAALDGGLVDRLGGLWSAVSVAKWKAGIDVNKKVQLVEVTFSQPSLTALISGSASALVQLTGLAGREAQLSAFRSLMLDAMLSDSPLRAMMSGAGGNSVSDVSGLGLDGGASPSTTAVSLLAPEISIEGMGCRVGQSGEATSTGALVQLATVLSGALTADSHEGKA